LKLEEKLRIITEAVRSKKAKDICTIDIQGISIIADYFLICSGTSKPNIQAISDAISEKCRDEGIEKSGIEGYQTGSWILHDLGDIIVHIMNEENREFYNLERLWKDGKMLKSLSQ
jgi:ribosome-associated protein